MIGEYDITHISFDHDLGYGNKNKTGYDVACYIEALAEAESNLKKHNVEYVKVPHPTWEIHSRNPVGRKRIEQAMKSAERYWNGE
jgi:hypothetical protein